MTAEADPETCRQAIAALVAIGMDPALLEDYHPHRDEHWANARAARTYWARGRWRRSWVSGVKAVYTLPIPRVMVSTRRCRWLATSRPTSRRGGTHRLYRRRDSSHWWINIQWRGYPRIHQTTLTDRKGEARSLLATLHSLRAAGRRDLLSLIADRRLELHAVHAAYLNDPGSLAHLRVTEPSPGLGVLVGEWLKWMESPSRDQLADQASPRAADYPPIPHQLGATVCDAAEGA